MDGGVNDISIFGSFRFGQKELLVMNGIGASLYDAQLLFSLLDVVAAIIGGILTRIGSGFPCAI